MGELLVIKKMDVLKIFHYGMVLLALNVKVLEHSKTMSVTVPKTILINGIHTNVNRRNCVKNKTFSGMAAFVSSVKTLESLIKTLLNVNALKIRLTMRKIKFVSLEMESLPMFQI